MQTKSIDALRLWWRDINFTNPQRRALAVVGILAVGLSGFLILKPHKADAITPVATSIVAPPMLVIDIQG